jgi:glycogen operon protein
MGTSCRLLVLLPWVLACGRVPAADAPSVPVNDPMGHGPSLGASREDDVVHFRVRADAAETVEVDVYAAARGADEVGRFPMKRSADGAAWAVDIPRHALAAAGVTDVVYYGYRAWGPNWHFDAGWTKGSRAGLVQDIDASGNRYNPNKLLVDPYGREISHDPLQPDQPSWEPYTSIDADDGKIAPKSILLPADASDVGTAPTRAFKDDIVYEVHLRGFTMNDPSVDPALRGTFGGAAQKADMLAALGVTAVEFLPIQETQNDRNDADPASANYWGYSTLAFFAPDRRFAADKSPGGPTREFKAMVKAFHARGIKVLLDVVYNHTAEETASGATRMLSFRGLDNAAYYELGADHRTPVDNTGVGGNFNTASPVVRDLVIDSLAYWHKDMGVDGFRFDLGVVLGNSCASVCYAFDANDPSGILQRAVKELPVRPASGGDGVELVAEPWANGAGTYQLGHFPAGWSEWNGTFRDSIRAGQNELGSMTPAMLAAKIGGSPDLFAPAKRAPASSVNYIDCHDGFTLADVYSYDAPNNAQPYPYGPSSGGSATNHSSSQGGSAALQLQAIRTGLALVALAAGVPMVQGGDEMRRTQHGNNNAYNLDNSAIWLDWSLAIANADVVEWSRSLFTFRRAHAALRPAAFFDGTDHDGNGLPDVVWLDTTGAAASSAYMQDKANHFLAWRLDGAESADVAPSIYIAWNGWTSDLTSTLPPARASMAWYRVGDSASGSLAAPGAETPLGASSVTVAARSLAILIER